jgi:hypothetical protein
MKDEKYEWDDRKAKTNLNKHEISFEVARGVFDDPRNIEKPDEDRFLITGMTGDLLVTVCYTERGRRKRIISARRANSHEQDSYFTQEPQSE